MGPNFTQCKFDMFLQTLRLIGNAEIHVALRVKQIWAYSTIYFWGGNYIYLFINYLPVY